MQRGLVEVGAEFRPIYGAWEAAKAKAEKKAQRQREYRERIRDRASRADAEAIAEMFPQAA
jgi:hypothetical protein